MVWFEILLFRWPVATWTRDVVMLWLISPEVAAPQHVAGFHSMDITGAQVQFFF